MTTPVTLVINNFSRTAASADATMATWGGSTVDNLESITEDGGGDQQDNDDEDDDGTVNF